MSGGTGGIGANLEDMRLKAGVLRGIGSVLGGRAADTARIAVDVDLLESAILSPPTAAAAESQIGTATAYLAVIATDTTVSAVFLDGAVTAYETADAALAAATTALRNGVMFVVGVTIIPVGVAIAAGAAAVGVLYVGATAAANAIGEAGDAFGQGVRTTVGLVQQNPWLMANPSAVAGVLVGNVVSSYSMQDVVDGTTRDLQASLEALAALAPGAAQAANEWAGQNGWVVDLVTDGAPGLLTGLSFFLGGGIGGGLALGSGVTGRPWPPLTYDQALESLLGGGGKFGFFLDGAASAVAVDPVDGDLPQSDRVTPGGISELFDGSAQIDDVDGDDSYARIRVIQVGDRWIVQIPSTQGGLADGMAGANPNDLTSDIHAMADNATALKGAVLAAMEGSHIPRGAEVMLQGFSLGGITAGLMASDPHLGYNVTHLVTGGSPIARFDIPESVNVLAFEFDGDPIARLDGRDNPDQANWTTVSGDAQRVTGQTVDPGMAGAHSADNYRAMAEKALADGSPSVGKFEGSASGYFGETMIVTDYEATRGAGS